MKFQWPQHSTQNLFKETKTKGNVTIELKNEREAELYRFHLYNYKRLKKLKENYSINLAANPDTGLKTRITLFLQPETEIKIIKT